MRYDRIHTGVLLSGGLVTFMLAVYALVYVLMDIIVRTKDRNMSMMNGRKPDYHLVAVQSTVQRLP